MNRRNENGSKVELKLNLSSQSSENNNNNNNRRVESSAESPTSPPSSCVSSDDVYSSSPESTSMLLVGCPRCLMYVMLSEVDPKCPKCKSTVLLDVLHHHTTTAPAVPTVTKKSKKN